MKSNNNFQLRGKEVRAVSKWMFVNKIEKVRIKHLVRYNGRDKDIERFFVSDSAPPTIESDEAVQLLSCLIERGLAKSYVGDSKVEYFELLYDGKHKEWKSITKPRGIVSYLKDGLFWCFKNAWLILLWALTVLAARILGNIIIS